MDAVPAPAYPCDLHTHTNRSDGADAPRELIDNAVAAGLRVVAICDHDVRPPAAVDVDGRAVEAVRYARESGLALIPGIEVSCETDVEDVHVVGLGCDWDAAFFAGLEAGVAASKVAGYRRLVEALGGLGMPMSWEEVLDNGGNPVPEGKVQKKMIFEAIARKGYADDWGAAKVLVKNTSELSIPREKPSAAGVIAGIKRSGGVAILAHPYLIAEAVAPGGRGMTRDAFIETLIDAGLDGIEACYTYGKTSYTGTMTAAAIEAEVRRKYAHRLRVVSGGSDYHADHRKGVANPRKMGEAGVTEEYFLGNPVLAQLIRA